jgi:hypothetical protein
MKRKMSIGKTFAESCILMKRLMVMMQGHTALKEYSIFKAQKSITWELLMEMVAMNLAIAVLIMAGIAELMQECSAL